MSDTPAGAAAIGLTGAKTRKILVMTAANDQITSPAQTIDQEASASTQLRPQLAGTMTGAAIRFDGWQSSNGSVSFGFNWEQIHAGSHVYVSASEVDNNGNRFNGAAAYTVQNVVVKEGRVEFRLVIDFDRPLRVSTDILTINP
jgi:hypothetical protein